MEYIFTDNAINDTGQDILDRKDYARKIAYKIVEYKNRDSLVLGVSGKWGSGKTSIVNMISFVVSSITNEFTIIEFNPWYFSNQKELINEFFETTVNALSSDKNLLDNVKRNEFAVLFNNYYKSLFDKSIANLSLKDTIKSSKLIKTAAMTFFPKFKDFSNNYAQIGNINELKYRINKFINENNVRILFIFDDIDRLSDEEIQQVFKLVKLVADFDNTIYLLSYDKEVVINSLNKAHIKKGEEYLEKIVQIPLTIPEISKNSIECILFENIEKINNNFGYEDFTNMYYGNLEKIFTNLRDINRFCNVLNFDYINLGNEINFIDFVYLTVIQVFSPKIYRNIFLKRDLLLGKNKNLIYEIKSEKSLKEERKKIIEDIIGKNENNLEKTYINIVKYLFPRLNQGVSESDKRLFDSELRVCADEHFNKYFELNIHDDDLTNEEFEKIIYCSADSEKFETEIINMLQNRKISIFLKRFLGYSYNNTSHLENPNVKNIIYSFFEFGDFFQEYNNNFRFMYQIIDNLLKGTNKNERFHILKDSIIKLNNSIFTALNYIYSKNKKYAEINISQENSINVEDLGLLLDEKEYSSLKEIILSKVEDYLENVEIKQSKYFSAILSISKLMNNEFSIDFLINKLDDNDLVDFITSFSEHKPTFESVINISSTKLVLNKKIYEFIPKIDFEIRVKNILDTNDFLNDLERKSLELFVDE
ncbi:P-loop NTPase fold protein [Methanobrevibacter arboriphilus]|uniref:KAP family P-loop NTPase fold protein n=1 Tax=Methanobrevibacter arboriphilus TaxID=39441 RepID=UPI0005B28459|nr:P-loop NTPase fold protein [Methanobrevibacter arboriphilus]